jgi:hypothetical protein
MVWSACEEPNPISAAQVEEARNRPLPRHVKELESRFEAEYERIEAVVAEAYPRPSSTNLPTRKVGVVAGRKVSKEVYIIGEFFQQYLDDPTERELTRLYRYLGIRALYNGVDEGSGLLDQWTD